MATVKVIADGSMKYAAAFFLEARRRAEGGKAVKGHILPFECRGGLARVMTGEHCQLLRLLHEHPEPSVSLPALRRQSRRVHADIAALRQADLVGPAQRIVRTTADRITADIRF